MWDPLYGSIWKFVPHQHYIGWYIFLDAHHLYLISDFNCQPDVQCLWGAQEVEQILFVPSVSSHIIILMHDRSSLVTCTDGKLRVLVHSWKCLSSTDVINKEIVL